MMLWVWQSSLSFWSCLVALGVAGFALHHMALWLERRGWLIYTRERRRSRASLALALAAAVDPSVRHVLEAQEREDLEETERGDDLAPPSLSPSRR